ncbi:MULTISPECIES: hypothetical protein [unclassified Stenotrophomonas]|uniref:hypothetical protein n=1 Tax=unclassified Stenotrophomonas TaxID=196198 RepID=UPI0017815059|nr:MULTISPECIES: hypothetical protein [unclassified Stenotrophomonas]MBD8637136.1 hypothetical protein [Stenotrophomonas sp. CFBP 13725]MBD8695944.1 hypothetical protein [Stenotrophomonas sp. CFBP 13718]
MNLYPIAQNIPQRAPAPMSRGIAAQIHSVDSGGPVSASNAVLPHQVSNGETSFCQLPDGKPSDKIKQAGTAERAAQARDPMLRHYEQDLEIASKQAYRAKHCSHLKVDRPVENHVAKLA